MCQNVLFYVDTKTVPYCPQSVGLIHILHGFHKILHVFYSDDSNSTRSKQILLHIYSTQSTQFYPPKKNIEYTSKVNDFFKVLCQPLHWLERWDRVWCLQMDNHNPRCSPSIIFLLPLSSQFLTKKKKNSTFVKPKTKIRTLV